MLKIEAGQSIVNPGDTLSASVNASALKDVALQQTSGDMRLGRVVSKTGDVYLTLDGDLIDALPPSGVNQKNESADQLIEKWKSLGIISEDGKDNSTVKKNEIINGYKTNINTLFSRYKSLKEYYSSSAHKNETDTENYKEYKSLKEMFGSYTSADKWLEAQNKDKNSEYYKLQNEVSYGWTQDQLLYAIQKSIINKESGSTTSTKDASDANIKGRNIIINAGGGIGKDEGYSVVDISDLQSVKGIESLKAIAAAEASDVNWGYKGDKVDDTKATINKDNGICIDATGYLKASAKGNIYLEDVNNNAIKITKVDSKDGNIRIYGKNGIYNATDYSADIISNPINLAGKDLIIEGGSGSIGTSDIPVTTSMSGFVTARSDKLINLFQLGNSVLTISAMYSGGNIDIRALKSILSVYNGVQADELGYINAKGNLSLTSINGDIGKANGKGLRIKVDSGKVLTANAEKGSIYIKDYGDSDLIIGNIKTGGNFGLEAEKRDISLKNKISAKAIEFIVKSLKQINGSVITNYLKVIADNGIHLPFNSNQIKEAYLVNNKTNDVNLTTKTGLTLHKADNKADNANTNIFAKGGSINILDNILSLGNLFIWCRDGISAYDLTAKNWMGLTANNGGISAKYLSAGSIDASINASAVKNDFSANEIKTNDYVKVNVKFGDIKIANDVSATQGNINLITKDGNISSNNITANNDIYLEALNGELKFKTINSKEGSVETLSTYDLSGDSIKSGKYFKVMSLFDVKLQELIGSSTDASDGSMLMKAEDDECSAYTLNVGKDLIINTNTGFINVEKAIVGEDSYISIDDNGGNIDIKDIQTGKDSVGDLIVVFHSYDDENNIKQLNIENAVAANKLIINSFANVILKSAYALNGRLEVKAAGDLVAELISSAKDTYISTISGTMNILKLISGDNLSVYSLAGGINIKDIETTNPEADIDMGLLWGDLSVSNASTTRDLEITNYEGKVTIDNVSSGGDINLVGADISGNLGDLLKDSKGTNFNLSNTSAGKDINIYTKLGNVSLLNTNAGNDLNVSDSAINSIDCTIGGDLTVNNFVSRQLSTVVKGNTNINNLKVNESANIKVAKDTQITDSSISQLNAILKGDATINKLTSEDLKAVLNGKSSIADSKLGNVDLTNKGEALIKDSSIKSMVTSNDGSFELTTTAVDNLDLTNNSVTNITNSTADKFDLIITGKATIKASTVNTMVAKNDATLDLTADSVVESFDLTNKSKGNALISDSTVKSMTASNDGELNINKITGDKLELTSAGNTNIDVSTIAKFNLTNTGESIIKDSKVNTIVAANDGKLEISATPVESLNLTNKSKGNALISESSVKSIIASNDGELNFNKLTGDKLQLTSAGNTNIDDSNIFTINLNINGSAQINKLVSNSMSAEVSGSTTINNSNIDSINANISGSSIINNLDSSHMSFVNSGNTNISDTSTNKITLTNSGKTNLNNIDVKANANVVNKNGNISINTLEVANNFDLDSNAGSISMKEIDIKKDFNFALTGNSGVKFTDITIGNDFNVYASKAVFNGASLNEGNNLNTYTYSKYTAPKASLRASFTPNSGAARASESEEGFSLIIDQLNISGGLYVENPDVTIEVKESTVGNDVKIDAGKKKIQIDKLDVDGGSLDIKGTTGSIKLGEIRVDNDTKINLGSGNLEVSDLNSKQEIDFKVGGNITSDKNIETQTGSVNMVAGGKVDAYKVLAKQQGNIEAVNGDIIIGQINGKTLVFKQDTNNRTLKIDEANVENRLTAGADYINIEKINQTDNTDRLGIDFTSVNGKAMKNVVVKDVKTDKGVEMNNLVSMYGNIHVSNEVFNLNNTYLLKNGDLSNSEYKFRLYGYNPVYSNDVNIIAFFSPSKNHKDFANISFTNENTPAKQDYIPLTSNTDFKRMFNQYTVVQEIEAFHLAYNNKIRDIDDDSYGKYDIRKLDNSKVFYVEPLFNEEQSDERVNLDNIEIPASLEIDSLQGNLKSVGAYIQPQPAID